MTRITRELGKNHNSQPSTQSYRSEYLALEPGTWSSYSFPVKILTSFYWTPQVCLARIQDTRINLSFYNWPQIDHLYIPQPQGNFWNNQTISQSVSKVIEKDRGGWLPSNLWSPHAYKFKYGFVISWCKLLLILLGDNYIAMMYFKSP